MVFELTSGEETEKDNEMDRVAEGKAKNSSRSQKY